MKLAVALLPMLALLACSSPGNSAKAEPRRQPRSAVPGHRPRVITGSVLKIGLGGSARIH